MDDKEVVYDRYVKKGLLYLDLIPEHDEGRIHRDLFLAIHKKFNRGNEEELREYWAAFIRTDRTKIVDVNTVCRVDKEKVSRPVFTETDELRRAMAAYDEYIFALRTNDPDNKWLGLIAYGVYTVDNIKLIPLTDNCRTKEEAYKVAMDWQKGKISRYSQAYSR